MIARRLLIDTQKFRPEQSTDNTQQSTDGVPLEGITKITMINAMIFDLDGTLVQTERLKALSYAKAAVELCPFTLTEEEVVDGFRQVVGRSRRDVAIYLVDEFDLAPEAIARMAEFKVNTPWQAFIRIRMEHYDKMLADPQVLIDNQWPHNVEVLKMARAQGCKKIGLATMSQ